EEMLERAVKVIANRMNTVGIVGDAARVPGTPDQIRVKIFGDQAAETIKSYLFTTHTLELKKVISDPYPSRLTTYPDENSARAVAVKNQEILEYSELSYSDHYRFVIVESLPVITGEEIRTARAHSLSNTGPDYSIAFTLNKQGSEKFGDWTGANIGNYIGVIVDNKVASAAFIKSRISDAGQIDGRFTKAAAEELAQGLGSGYLPVKLIVTEERRFRN
ncbi:MAG TPA: hypothetical protein VK468_11325, partial [Pyrinomonadaceae bacterium]|nr:hypothetical protein [Pyrinomonadaceae bacterium]